MRRDRPMEALLVDDCEGDIRLTREALREAEIPVRLSVARDGIEALALLRREIGFAEAPRPDLIVMDLNMPRMSGRELLAALGADPDLRIIPVIVLTTSNSRKDIRCCYALDANCYIIKPIDFDSFERALRSMQEFWFKTATLLPQEG